ncbi:FxLYD domain-containing protein [Secundilactobacillus kimchicus]|uniref:FxLYD domain-containing protein n=1 Tax=Secundilactobacillus kimchicus TaxID=528209 RepID=UPI0035203E6C
MRATNYSFKSFGIKVRLKNAKGVVVETVSVYVDNWNKGQTTRFEAMTDKKFTTYNIVKDYVE